MNCNYLTLFGLGLISLPVLRLDILIISLFWSLDSNYLLLVCIDSDHLPFLVQDSNYLALLVTVSITLPIFRVGFIICLI